MLRRARILIAFTTAACVGLASAALALDLPLPRGAQSVSDETSALDSYALPVGPYSEGDLPTEPLEGQVRRQAWKIDNNTATLLQITAPMRDHLHAKGYEILLDCDEESCGGFEFRFGTEVLPAPAMFVDLTNFRALTARKADHALSLLVSATGSRRFLQVIEVGARPAATPHTDASSPVGSPPTDLRAGIAETTDVGQMLRRTGRVVLDDLTFETGRTALSQGPYASLQALSLYLLENPTAQIALVGHTDAVGGLEGNIAISEARARAVQDRLTDAYGVPPAQITAQGIGFLSPRASNLTEAGRAENRRVEAVLLRAQ